MYTQLYNSNRINSAQSVERYRKEQLKIEQEKAAKEKRLNEKIDNAILLINTQKEISKKQYSEIRTNNVKTRRLSITAIIIALLSLCVNIVLHFI